MDDEKVLEFLSGKLAAAGLLRSVLCPQYYADTDPDGISCVVHGDDFIAEAVSFRLDRLDDLMSSSFVTKVLNRIGPNAHGSGKYLSRVLTYVQGKGFTYDADPRHAIQIVEDLGLQNAKSVGTLSRKTTGSNMTNALDVLPAERRSLYQKVTGRMLYLSLDR